jgi:hypothetical protein
MTDNQPLSRRDMTLHIQRLNRLNADVSEFKTIKQIYNRMFVGVGTIIGNSSGAELFFRARVNPAGRLTRVEELLAPPAEIVTGFQRCNAPHDPLFYCSSRRITALRECRVQPGDIVYLSQWVGKDHLPINKIFDMESHDKFGDQISEADRILYAHLDTVFTRRIHKTFSNDYKFSAAVTERLTTNYPPGMYQVGDDGRCGLRYPSVLDLENSYNTAFPPHFALDRIMLLHVMELRVETVEDDRIRVELLDAAIDFDDSAIRWSGNKLCVPALRDPDRSIAMRSNGVMWQIATMEHLVAGDWPVGDYVNELMLE